MLHYETIAPATLGLLKKLMADDDMPDFQLVGGTSLALQLGHRKSIDLDLFTNVEFDLDYCLDVLRNRYGLRLSYLRRQSIKGDIEGVKIDCIAHRYPWIRPAVVESGIRLASLEDVCAMKLNAISGNGTRIKDFVDIAELSGIFTFSEMLHFYVEKYNANSIIPEKSVTYFNDINFAEPVMLTGDRNLDWEQCANRIKTMVKNPDKIVK